MAWTSIPHDNMQICENFWYADIFVISITRAAWDCFEATIAIALLTQYTFCEVVHCTAAYDGQAHF